MSHDTKLYIQGGELFDTIYSSVEIICLVHEQIYIYPVIFEEDCSYRCKKLQFAPHSIIYNMFVWKKILGINCNRMRFTKTKDNNAKCLLPIRKYDYRCSILYLYVSS